MATKKCYRSKNGMLLGVCKGIAEWKDFPVGVIRLIFLCLLSFGNGFPIVAIYLVLAIVLPIKGEEVDENQSFEDRFKEMFKKANYKTGAGYYSESEKTNKDYGDEALKKRFDSLKNRVNNMEEDLFNKENDWETRFNKVK